jgi:uncharacterized protein (TIGR02266 family)
MAVHRYVKKAAALTNRRTDVRSRLEVEVEVSLEVVPAEARRPESEAHPPPEPSLDTLGTFDPREPVPATADFAPIPTRRRIVDGIELGPMDLGPEPEQPLAPIHSPEVGRGAPAPVDAGADLDVEVGLHTDTNFYTGLSQDISAGGVFIATNRIRPVGERMILKFSLPDHPTPIVARAEVRWTRDANPGDQGDSPPGMGLRFIGLSPEAQAAISRFLEQRESLFYDDE